MMDFLMPSLGADMESATLVEWLAKPGDAIHIGDIIAVVETQKGAIDIEVFVDGTIAELVANKGDTVPVGGLLARIATSAAAPVAVPAHAPAPAPVASKTLPCAPIQTTTEAARAVRASPAARRRAADLGIDLERLTGSGVGGAVSFADVELARMTGRQIDKSPTDAPRGMFDPSAMRRAIAAAMTRSKREIPHYYLSSIIDMQPALDWLARYNAARPPDARMLPTVLLLKAAALALRKVPHLNGFWQDDRFQPGQGIHIGWAISLRGGGLVAPAIHAADQLALPELMDRMRDLVARARSSRLRSSEVMDATITITSLGERGADAVTGIIYPPQVAILGFGRIAARPCASEGQVVVHPVVHITLAADHRASDGHLGGLLLSAIAGALTEPDTL